MKTSTFRCLLGIDHALGNRIRIGKVINVFNKKPIRKQPRTRRPNMLET